jgi:hypothetical protein
MGEAKRRREARANAFAGGMPVPRPNHCPGCGSRRVHVLPMDKIPDALRAVGVNCDHALCLSCGALWETFPPLYVEDSVCAEPCDNCAFRPGSPEQEDPEHWRSMIETLKPDGKGWFTGRFYCHKNTPIDQAKGPGNFLFPQKPILMDGEPVLQPDGTAATHEDVTKMRTCSGFLRMFWKLNEKRERGNVE